MATIFFDTKSGLKELLYHLEHLSVYEKETYANIQGAFIV